MADMQTCQLYIANQYPIYGTADDATPSLPPPGGVSGQQHFPLEGDCATLPHAWRYCRTRPLGFGFFFLVTCACLVLAYRRTVENHNMHKKGRPGGGLFKSKLPILSIQNFAFKALIKVCNLFGITIEQ